MFFLHWTFNWPPLLALLRLPSTLFNITGIISWLWRNREGKISIEHDIESSGKGSCIIEDPAIASVKGADYSVRNSKGDFIASGASGILERLPSGDVVKSPWPGSGAAECCREIALESRIYKKLGPHPRLIPIIDWDPRDCALTMEYMPNGTLKDFLLAHKDSVSTTLRLQWAKEAAEGLQLLHSASIIHCDVEPKNFLLDASLSLKIADFSGSSLEGSRASACAGKRFTPPDLDWRRQSTVQDDMFGLGSTIYYIMTSQHPFQELPSDEVEVNYRSQTFPDVASLTCGRIITRCWKSEFASAQEIYDCIQVIA